MRPDSRYEKAKRKLNGIITQKVQGTPFQFSIYRSWWHMRLFGNKMQQADGATLNKQHFLAEKPNYGAGIGHQLANWNAGFHFSAVYGIPFAHFPFSNTKWEHFLGFGQDEQSALALLKDSSFKKIKLPLFNSEKKEDVSLVEAIIQSYKNERVLFLLAQDQGYMMQCDTYADLSAKFFAATARKEDKFFYNKSNFNIAVHIRRGDVAAMKKSGEANWEERWLNNEYYTTVLSSVLATLGDTKNIQVYLFSQGTKEDFPEFDQFSNINYCLDVNAYDSFLHMVYANVLISSKSSFSYKPALISKGIKICPANFWHGYPAVPEFILADDNGKFNTEQLYAVKEKMTALLEQGL